MTDKKKPDSSTLSAGDARLVMGWKMIEYLGLASFIIIIPREMGPERYGELAVLNSLVGLFMLATALGGQVSFGRFIPEFRAQGREDLTRILFTQYLVLRCLIVTLVAVIFYSLLQRFLPDASPTTRWAAAALLFVGAVSMTSYQLQFGLNRLARWMSRDSSTRLLLVLLLFVLGGNFDLERIVLTMLAIECVFLVLGFYWSRHFFAMDKRLFQFSTIYEYLKFGVLFFLANMLLMVIWRAGELIVVELSGQGPEAVAYYSVANAITITLYALFAQLGVMIVPSLSSMHISGEHEKKTRWLANVLKYTNLGAWGAAIVVKSVGEPIVKLLMGEEYLPVTDNLLILILALIPMNVVRIAISSALVQKRLRSNLYITASALAVFLVSAVLLTPEYGAEGTSMAVVIGATGGAIVAYRVFRMGEVFALSRYWALSLAGALALAIPYSGLLPDIAGGLLAILFLLTAVLMFRILGMDELRWITGVKKRNS